MSTRSCIKQAAVSAVHTGQMLQYCHVLYDKINHVTHSWLRLHVKQKVQITQQVIFLALFFFTLPLPWEKERCDDRGSQQLWLLCVFLFTCPPCWECAMTLNSNTITQSVFVYKTEACKCAALSPQMSVCVWARAGRHCQLRSHKQQLSDPSTRFGHKW